MLICSYRSIIIKLVGLVILFLLLLFIVFYLGWGWGGSVIIWGQEFMLFELRSLIFIITVMIALKCQIYC